MNELERRIIRKVLEITTVQIEALKETENYVGVLESLKAEKQLLEIVLDNKPDF